MSRDAHRSRDNVTHRPSARWRSMAVPRRRGSRDLGVDQSAQAVLASMARRHAVALQVDDLLALWSDDLQGVPGIPQAVLNLA